MNIALCVFGLILMVISFKLFTFTRGVDVEAMNSSVYEDIVREGKISANMGEVKIASSILRGLMVGISFALLAAGIWVISGVFL